MAPRAKKTSRRTTVMDSIFDVITNVEIYETIKYRSLDEARIKQYIYQPLAQKVCNMFVDLAGYTKEKAKEKSRTALCWEGDQKTTVNNFVFFGVQHRPDFSLEILDTSFAIEIKRGESGADIRSGIGQSLVYSSRYDFCAYLFIDTSPDKKIVNAFSSDKERAFTEQLWENYNIRFEVV